MEEKKSKVILHGMWASTYSKRVEIALKLKGISYEYVEEDLKNKTESLIQLSPVLKKIPLLVHDGKPVADTQVILDYIDETWKEKAGDPSPMEEDMLDFAFDVRPTSRLSCQIKITDELDGLEVNVPERQA